MKININNYEEFFLMYADNELTPQDRTEVEDFIQQNPQFKEEFLLICDAILTPETQVFSFKDSLYKTEDTTAKSSTEEKLLLYIDNELSKEEMASTELAIAGNDHLKKEASILMNTRSLPDLSITYPNKFSLYKKEERKAPILWFKWAAAAAISIGFGWFSVGYFTTSKAVLQQSNSVAVKPSVTPQNQVINNSNPTNQAINPTTTNLSTDNKETLAQSSQKTNTRGDDIIKNATNNKQDKKSVIPVIDNKQIANNTTIENKPMTNDLPVPDPNYNNRKITNSGTVTQPDNSIENNLATRSAEPATQSDYTLKPISYIERDENNDDGERSIAGEQFHKSKLGIFLKKASRTVVRNLKVKDRDDQN